MKNGIIASNGLAIGKVYKIKKNLIEYNNRPLNLEDEFTRLNKAIKDVIKDLENIKSNFTITEDKPTIIDAHISMCNDPEFIKLIKKYLNLNNSVEKAIGLAIKEITDSFDLTSDYTKQRISDIEDVKYRLLYALMGIDNSIELKEEVIIVADDLMPSITVQLDKKYLLGFVTENGSRTSHTSIIARSFNLPAIVGLKGIYDACNDGDILLLDAINNEVIINPDKEKLNSFNLLKENYLKELQMLAKYKNVETKTLDNKHIDLSLNIASLSDFEMLDNTSNDGVGLCRTEFLYMNKDHLPSEDEQFNIYKKLLEFTQGKRTIIRTIDIGGDKGLPYLKFDKEPNPFLGYRAIRMSLDRPDIFIPQIRAILKASIYGKIGIMFPMIATVDEFIKAKQIVLDEKAKLLKNGIKVSDDIQIGMMVEIPSSAVLADEFSKYADFFSIGTNDLIQYTMAQDRTNPKVSYLYQPLNPSLLRLIKMTIDGAHKHNKLCKLCGEIAEDETALKILVGLGIDEISLPITSISKARKLINSIEYAKFKDLASKSLELSNQEEVRKLISSK